jgi:hypothetical protein
MCVFKNHAFIYFLRPPSWSGTSSPHFYNQRGRVLIGLQVGKVINAPLLRKLIGKVLIELLESQGFILARNTSTHPQNSDFFSLPWYVELNPQLSLLLLFFNFLCFYWTLLSIFLVSGTLFTFFFPIFPLLSSIYNSDSQGGNEAARHKISRFLQLSPLSNLIWWTGSESRVLSTTIPSETCKLHNNKAHITHST